jgi:hypothetical protein
MLPDNRDATQPDATHHTPTTIRERIAWALCVRDTFGSDPFTQLLDEQLQELTDIVTYLHAPGLKHGLSTAWTRSLIAQERRARGWDHEQGVIHINWRHDIIEDTWRQWLPMADVAVSILIEIPEVARRVRTELDSPTPELPDPDPIPDPPLPPPGL